MNKPYRKYLASHKDWGKFFYRLCPTCKNDGVSCPYCKDVGFQFVKPDKKLVEISVYVVIS